MLDRQTLQRIDGGPVNSDVAGMQQLGAIIDQYTGSLGHLVVLNGVAFAGGFDDASINGFDSLLRKIGAPKLTTTQRSALSNWFVSAIGVAGALAGSAFVKVGQLGGSLRLNGVTGEYDFVFSDVVDFDKIRRRSGSATAKSDRFPAIS